jgi:hypothetical protein
MKNYPSRGFIIACFIYLSAVVITFISGVTEGDSDGVSFVPTMVLTFPWSFFSFPNWLLPALIAVYDLPQFLFSALLNVCLADLIRRRFHTTNSNNPLQ